MSALAESLLGVTETQAVNRHITEYLVPADAEASGPEDLVNLVIHAARGAGEVHEVVLRPTAEFGIRYWGRIGPCGPPRAALIVLGDGTSRLASTSAPGAGLLPLQASLHRAARVAVVARAARRPDT